ncbi:MAG: sodium:calcium antiporter [Planctomycetota bacterium]|nr:MAG: sodium:calcium antiporter [Planctomycetota bacterium]
MFVLIQVLGILASTLAVAWGASWLVDSAAKIAKKFEISELVIGLTVVAFGTSAPEFAVSITAALKDYGDISVGNIVGSNIFNLGFILGGCALIVPIQSSPLAVKRDGFFLLMGTILLCIFIPFLGPQELSRLEGGILFSLLIFYLLYLYWNRSIIDMEEIPAEKATGMDWFWLILGMVLVVGGGHYLVIFSAQLARYMGLSEWVIAVTIVAAGTSVPEMATSLAAALKGRHGISAGNLIGSDIFNMYGVLGLAALIRPLHIDPASTGSVFALIFMVGLTLIFLRTGWKVSRLEGSFLVLIAILRWGYNLRSLWM